MKIIEKILDVNTGEETLVERDETPTEKKEREALEKAALIIQTELAAKAVAKAELLEKLGITQEEAKLLLS